MSGRVSTGELPDQLFYVVGTDVGVSDRFSLALDLLGQHVFDTPLLVERAFAVGAGGPHVRRHRLP